MSEKKLSKEDILSFLIKDEVMGDQSISEINLIIKHPSNIREIEDVILKMLGEYIITEEKIPKELIFLPKELGDIYSMPFYNIERMDTAMKKYIQNLGQEKNIDKDKILNFYLENKDAISTAIFYLILSKLSEGGEKLKGVYEEKGITLYIRKLKNNSFRIVRVDPIGNDNVKVSTYTIHFKKEVIRESLQRLEELLKKIGKDTDELKRYRVTITTQLEN